MLIKTFDKNFIISVLLRLLSHGHVRSGVLTSEHAPATLQGQPQDHQTEVLAQVSALYK